MPQSLRQWVVIAALSLSFLFVGAVAFGLIT
jgi:hypothetical protein